MPEQEFVALGERDSETGALKAKKRLYEENSKEQLDFDSRHFQKFLRAQDNKQQAVGQREDA